MSTAAFVLASALVVAAQIAFALAYGGAGALDRPEPIEAESERELQALVLEVLDTGPEVRTAPPSGADLSGRSAAPADRRP